MTVSRESTLIPLVEVAAEPSYGGPLELRRLRLPSA
jgi:hypothetical protein